VHTTGLAPTQAPAWHVSVLVHAVPSSHALPFAFAGFVQTPVPVLQVPALWHWSLAVHTTGFAPVQTPAWQVSDWVHALPSLQAEPFGSFAVQFFPASLQLSAQLAFPFGPGQGLPAWFVHAPAALHVSAPLQKVPSSHVVPLVTLVHVPGDAPLQVTQSVATPPPQLLVQHTVSTHDVPTWHIWSRLHEPPGPFTGWHELTLQK